MKSSQARNLLMPWAGLLAGFAGVAINHQFGSEGVFDSCAVISPVPLLVVAALCFLLAVGGGLASLGVLRGDSETPVRKLVAILSLGCAALFCLAIVLPMIASILLPPCFQ